MDFGGDIAQFGDAEQATLHEKLANALGLKLSDLKVTRHAVDEAGLNLGAVGHGHLWHPTKVQLNFRFVGTDAIEHGRQLEQDVENGKFVLDGPLKPFPLLRIEIEEIYCTSAPTAAPTVKTNAPVTPVPTEEPTANPTHVPTENPTVEPTQEPTAKPTVTPTEEPTAVPTATPTEIPTTLAPTTDKPSFSPTATPTEEPTAVPTATPTEEPTAEPTVEPTAKPTVEPTAKPTVEPTAVPTEEPTAKPTVTPTEEPTIAPTGEPSFTPTSAPTDLPTLPPTKPPTGCLVRAAKMHILFKDNARTGSMTVAAMQSQILLSHEKTLQSAVAKELHLAPDALAVRSFHQANGIQHTELRFKGLRAIKYGRDLERKVLADQFHPIPNYPIHRLYLEEVFDCGAHAVGATHPYDGTNDGAVKWSLSDSGYGAEHGTSNTWSAPTVVNAIQMGAKSVANKVKNLISFSE
jgi:hypothetical protein